ncbi:MAG: hypothetical protein WC369_06200 [Dehalococcoidales bacterium]|jgi:hypothetical protein
MPEELGKIEKPQASQFTNSRKLYFVPLANIWPKAEKDYTELFEKYWAQVTEQLAGLEQKLGIAKKLYHEFVTDGGEEGVKIVGQINSRSAGIINEQLKRGAILEAVEDEAVLHEFMDWSRCLSIGLQSEPALSTVLQAFSEVSKKRNDQLARCIDETLGTEETGVLFMREGHQIQFAQDIQVIYIAPPALDEMKRWLRDQAAAKKEA